MSILETPPYRFKLEALFSMKKACVMGQGQGFVLRLQVLLTALCLCACQESKTEPIPPILDQGIEPDSIDSWWSEDFFDDHTAHALSDRLDFERLAETTPTMSMLKFWLIEPIHGQQQGWSDLAHISFLDSAFYDLHDELYWYRLLNGARVWGFEIDPLDPPLEIYSISEISEAMRALAPPLPLELKFTSGGRLYATEFYDRVGDRPNRIVVGSLVHIQAHPERSISEEIWAFELGYTGVPELAEVESLIDYFDRILPSDLTPIRWLTRSTDQEAIGRELIEIRPDLVNQVISYEDLVVPGESAVYSEGITAGRLRLMEEVESPTEERDILIYNELPDDLPACRGLITSIPQTPLAHLNLLARNRGIPNLYSAGISQQAPVASLARARAAVLLWSRSPDEWRLLPLTADEYRRYLSLRQTPSRELSRPPIEETPYDYPLQRGLDLQEILSLRPQIGGKATGVLIIDQILAERAELASSIVSPPLPSMALSGRAYAEHIEPIEALIAEALASSELKVKRHLQSILLEGWTGLTRRAPSAQELEETHQWIDAQSADLKSLISSGGVQGWIKETPIARDTLDRVLSLLKERFAELSPYQGLRFRSSSNVEDLEGFNGAGLYGSESGYLFPHVQRSERDRVKSVARALRSVWASYWSLEAFEERSLEGINHLKGWMGILIHPQFQNELELSNGVMTLTLAPRSAHELGHDYPAPTHDDWLGYATLNSQLGSESVTNPSAPHLLTELIEVKIYREPMSSEEENERALYRFEIEKSQRSTLSDQVLNEAQIKALVEESLIVTETWREALNSELTSSQGLSAFTLDFEYRIVDPSWPLLRSPSEEVGEALVILKQARPLEPALPQVAEEESVTHIPLDLLRRVSRINKHICRSEQIELSITTSFTDPLIKPDVGFSVYPFISEISYTDHRTDARRPGLAYRLTHRDYSVLESPEQSNERRGKGQITLERDHSRDLPFERLELDLDQGKITWSPRLSTGELERPEPISARVNCELSPLFASPQDYLKTILESARLDEGLGSLSDR